MATCKKPSTPHVVLVLGVEFSGRHLHHMRGTPDPIPTSLAFLSQRETIARLDGV